MKLRSGENAPCSGEYKVCSSSGEVLGTVHVSKGDSMPPTQHSSQYFVIEE